MGSRDLSGATSPPENWRVLREECLDGVPKLRRHNRGKVIAWNLHVPGAGDRGRQLVGPSHKGIALPDQDHHRFVHSGQSCWIHFMARRALHRGQGCKIVLLLLGKGPKRTGRGSRGCARVSRVKRVRDGFRTRTRETSHQESISYTRKDHTPKTPRMVHEQRGSDPAAHRITHEINLSEGEVIQKRNHILRHRSPCIGLGIVGLAAFAVAAAVEGHDLPSRRHERFDDPGRPPVPVKAAGESVDKGYGRTTPFHDVVDGHAASLECRHRTLPVRAPIPAPMKFPTRIPGGALLAAFQRPPPLGLALHFDPISTPMEATILWVAIRS